MGYYNDVINVIGLLDNIADGGETETNLFDLLLISRSIVYHYGWNRLKGGLLGSDSCGKILDKLRVSNDLDSVFETEKFFKRDKKKQDEVIGKISASLYEMASALSNLNAQVFFGLNVFGNEFNLVMSFLYGLFMYLSDGSIDFLKSDLRKKYQTKETARSVFDVLVCYSKLNRCETLLQNESVRLKKEGKEKSSKIMHQSYRELKKADRISTMKKVIDCTEKALEQTGEEPRGFSVFGIFRKVLSYISRKLTMRKVKQTSQSFFKRAKSTLFSDRISKEAVYNKIVSPML